MVCVLLVEDNEGDIELVRMSLAECGLNDIQVALDADAALVYLGQVATGRHPRPGVVILDLRLPRGHGHDVLAWIRADTRLRCIPVVVYSTSLYGPEVQRSLALGALHVPKPSTFEGVEEFARTVCGLLSEQKSGGVEA
jgi:CheY-like chemotaxis protein